MTIEESIVRLENLVLALDADMTRREEAQAAKDLEKYGQIVGRLHELAADTRLTCRDDLKEQVTALWEKLGNSIRELSATVMAERQRLISLDEIKHTLKAFASASAQAEIEKNEAKRAAVLPEIVKREFAAMKPVAKNEDIPNLASIFRGNWTAELELKRGDIFVYHGGCYLVLILSRGVIPTREELDAKPPRYALLSTSGAPGQNGLDGKDGAISSLVTAPATASSLGTAGTFAYSAGYVYYCIATNTWRRWAALTF